MNKRILLAYHLIQFLLPDLMEPSSITNRNLNHALSLTQGNSIYAIVEVNIRMVLLILPEHYILQRLLNMKRNVLPEFLKDIFKLTLLPSLLVQQDTFWMYWLEMRCGKMAWTLDMELVTGLAIF